jgi:WD40 repeat protein
MADHPPGRSFVQAAVDAALKAGFRPVDMGQFAARQEAPAAYCQARVRECDIYLAMIGFRYGSLVPDRPDGVSYTELEFLTATAEGMPRLVFLVDQPSRVPRRLVDPDRRAIDGFRRRLLDAGLIVRFVTGPADLGAAVLHALYEIQLTQLKAEGAAAAGTAASGEEGTPRRPWMAPPLDRIVERAELGDRLTAALVAPGGAEVGLAGPGGFGKTRLATWACRQEAIDRRYPGGLLWVTVGQEASGAHLAERINDLSFVLSGQRPAISDPDAAGGELGRLLDERKPVLLVIDDVWEEAQLRPFRFGGRGCGRLVTTRLPDLLPENAARIRVDAMSDDQARRLVGDGVAGLSPEAAEALGAAAGGWPVLLNLINGVLKRRVERGETPEQAASGILQKLRAGGPAALDPARPTDRNRAVAATVDASLNLLTARDRQLYLELSIFPENAEIPLDVLGLLWDEDDPDPLCEELVRLGLVADYKLDPPGPRLVLHEVLRAYLRGRLTAAERVGVHRRLVDAAARELPDFDAANGSAPWWTLATGAHYLWRFLPYHLAAAEASDELADLVCDLRWVEAKTRVFGSAVGVEADLSLVHTPVARALRSALRHAAPLLGPIDPPDALAATLASRLFGVPELTTALDAYRATLRRPFLEPAQVLPDQPGQSAGSDVPDGPGPGGPPAAAGHSGSVTSCAFSPDGTLFATGSDDRTVRLWNVSDWTEHAVLTGSAGGIWGCAFSPDGMLLATAGDDRTVRLWNVSDGTESAVLRGHTEWVNGCAFSPDGALLASGGDDRTVRLWNVSDGTESAVLRGHTGWVNGCAFSPDGALLASASDDRTVRLWNVSDGTQRAVFTGHTGNVRSCAFSPDGTLIATASRDQTVRLWRSSTGVEQASLADDVGWMTGCVFSPDGMLLVGTSSEGTATVWRLPDLAEQATLVGDTGWITSCAFSRDGTLLAATSSEGGARVWRMPDGVPEATFAGDNRRVNGCAFAPGGTLLATARSDGEVRLLSRDGAGAWTRLGDLAGHAGGVRTCVFSPDGALLATASDDRTARLWRIGGDGPPTVLTGHTGRVTGCSFSPDGTLLATSGNDRTVRLWRVPDGAPQAALTGHPTRVTSCAFSPTGDVLATTGEEGTVKLWRMPDGVEHGTLGGHTGWVNDCDISPDGSLLATAGDDRTARLWRIADATARTVLAGNSGWVQGCAFAPDGRLLATISRDGTVRLWDTADGGIRCALRVAGSLFGVTWHPDGGLLGLAGGAGVYLLAFRP